MSLRESTLTQTAAVFDNLPVPVEGNEPRSMEAYDQGHGCMVYRTEIPAGPQATLQVPRAHDFAWVFVDGKPAGVMDRRSLRYSVKLPAREKRARLDILVEAMGHVNFGNEVHDRKGLIGPVKLTSAMGESTTLADHWQVFPLPLDASQLAKLKWKTGAMTGPGFWRGTFNVAKSADTFWSGS
jgi:beta-galactosidase